MINHKMGSILDCTEEVIAHQVNCMAVYNAGLAKQIRSAHPAAYQSYMRMFDRIESNNDLLGKVDIAKVDNGKYVANIFGQYGYGRDKRYTNYGALSKGLEYLAHVGKKYKRSIAIPHGVGCGLAGGDLVKVIEIIDNAFKDYEVTIYRYIK